MMRRTRSTDRPLNSASIRIARVLVTSALLASGPTILHAQDEDRPEEDAGQQQVEEQLLEDFGSGLRAFAALLDDPEIDIDELKELYAAAEEAIDPDIGMSIYVDGYEENQQQDELADFRQEVIDLHYGGEISRQEALSTWLEVIDVRFFHNFKKDDVDWSDRMLDADRTGNLAPLRLRIPDAGDVRTLIRPEFLMRDLKFFSQELDLDDQTRAVIEVLLRDYVTAYERRAEELKAAIRAARMRIGREAIMTGIEKADSTLDRVESTIDWTELRGRIDGRFAESGREEWAREGVDRFQRSLNGIRKAIDRRRLELDRETAAPPDSRRVLQLATSLQSDRRGMRDQLIEGMMLVLDEEQQEALKGIFTKFTLEQGRIDAKLGGARINLDLALGEALGEEPMSDAIRESLESINGALLQLVDRWISARMNRERSGLQLFVAYQGDDESGVDKLTASHGQRSRTELSAAIAIRDQLMAGQSVLEAMVAKSDPEAASRFSMIATRQGFAPQMRPRWCERAISTIDACADLDEEQRTTLTTFATNLSAQLQPIREQAIQIRLTTEPRIAQAGIDRMIGRKTTSSTGILGWREPGAEQFRAVDLQVESQLEALLTGMTCAETMPRRRGKEPPSDPDGKNNGQRRGR